MSKLRAIRVGLLIVSLGMYAAAQDTSQTGAAPAPAFGQSAPVLNPDNPPLSGLDEPGLDLKAASRSFISPALQVGETVDSNESNQINTSVARPVTHVLGAFDLQRFWPKNDLFVEYLGGGAFEAQPSFDAKQLQMVGVEGVARWRTGYMKLRDVFSYLPDGSFDLATGGGLPGLGIVTGMGTGEAGGGVAGLEPLGRGSESVGDIPHLQNIAALDIVQAINPRSAVTLLGAFGNSHFYDNCQPNSTLSCLVDSDQTTVEAGYSHLISRRDQIAGIYAFQLFRFPFSTGGEVYNDVFNLRWSHTISGRMKLVVGAGPQYTDLRFAGGSPRWSLSGRASLRYQFEHSSLVLSWEKYTSAGSGFFAGANTQLARLAFRRPLGRSFVLLTDLGYAHNQRLQPSSDGVDVSVNNYNEGTAGVVLRKHMGRTYDLFASYRFNEVGFDASICETSTSTNCGSINDRHRGTIGVEWHPRPTRIE